MQVTSAFAIPEVKPAIESVRGQWFRKMSPRTRHALVQGRMLMLLSLWADGRGDVGTEWRFILSTPDESPNSLVPDVAFVASGRLAQEPGDARESPAFAPDIAVEVLSPGDRLRLLETKIGIYIAHGTRLVIVVDPATRTIRTHELRTDRTFHIDDVVRSDEFPDLTIDVHELFHLIV
jgi:Uma2 family endonuclease